MNFLFASISTIISNFKGEMPLANYLKKYFKQHPKLGSRDRKSITEAVYIYYRCAKFFRPNSEVLDVIQQGMEIVKSENNYLKDNFQKINNELQPDQEFKIENWEPGSVSSVSFSEGMNRAEWLNSIIVQPDLFIRFTIDKSKAVQKLNDADLKFQEIEIDENMRTVFALKNASQLDRVFKAKEFVVQDWASQCSMVTIMNFVELQGHAAPKMTVWDVCAGAGGKSIFWKEKRASDFLLATDIRMSALKNLKERFSIYNIEHFQALTVDVTDALELSKKLKKQNFDVVICDAPCSGSGTWARTPEEFYFFNQGKLVPFAEQQYKIAFSAQKQLKKDGVFAYITCSVFKEENEAVVQKLLATTSLQLMEQKLINGISHKADSMFVALFKGKKPS